MENKENNMPPIKSWSITKDTAISLGVVISMISVAVWTTSNHKLAQYSLLKANEEISHLQDTCKDLESRLTYHEAKGINGLPHPEAMVEELKKMQNDLGDRWRRADDFVFMKDFAILNNLKMPSHRTVKESATSGD